MTKVTRRIVVETMKSFYFHDGNVFSDFDDQMGVHDEYDAIEVEKWLGDPGFANKLLDRRNCK